MLVTNVAIHSRPVMRASLRAGISARRADADDRFGEDVDMPSSSRALGTGHLGRDRGQVNAAEREPLDHPAGRQGEARADHTFPA